MSFSFVELRSPSVWIIAASRKFERQSIPSVVALERQCGTAMSPHFFFWPKGNSIINPSISSRGRGLEGNYGEWLLPHWPKPLSRSLGSSSMTGYNSFLPDYSNKHQTSCDFMLVSMHLTSHLLNYEIAGRLCCVVTMHPGARRRYHAERTGREDPRTPVKHFIARERESHS